MLKKTAAIALVLILMFSALSACGKENGESTESASAEQTSAEKQTETEKSSESGPETETAPVSSEEPETEPTLPPTGPAWTKEALNFRKGPGTEYEKITTLPAGTMIEVIERGSDWTHARYEGQEGYASTAYLSFDDAPEPASSETAAPTSEQPSDVPYDPNSGILVDNGLFDLSGLPNVSIPYGNDWDNKDAAGLPTGVHYYENLYGKYYPVYYIKTDKKLLYLTMDEGYEAGFTPRILDILKAKNVHAVFFITKQFYDSNPELIQRMIDEGHTLGNHTCLHPSGGFPRYVDAHGLESFVDDIQKLHKLVYDRFGYSMRLFRFPEGESSELLMAQLDNFGYTSVFWSYAHDDYHLDKQPEVSVTLERCLSHMGNGAVYLLHAVSESNTNALSDFIDGARAAGFEFGDFPVEEVSRR